VLEKEIKKLLGELNILKERTIKFARNSREITSKSYGLGNSTYVELLQSELKLQKILMNKVMLEAKRDIKRATLKYVKGEPLNE
jgi:outer membrane protein TolC